MNLNNYVEEIISDINKNGIESVKKYSRKFDDYEGKLKVSDGEWEKAKEIPEQDKEIIEKTIDRIFRYHETQIEEDNIFLEDSSIYGTIYRSLERVGLYVPGGKPLPSSLMMTGVPARIAGVDEIVVSSPPSDGEIDPYVLYTAEALGFSEVYKIGGVQAIASMAYGIGMERVDKIFGPGNKYVNEAKRQVYGDVGIDSLAGPSDICVIADDSADEDSVLMDLLSQLEHGVSSEAWLLTTSQDLADYCSGEDVEIFVFNDLGECVRKSNEIAPEHLEIITDNPLDLVDDVQNAGAIYLGEYTPVPAADYFLGVNHVLPTGSAARFDSVLTVMDFMKPISLAYVSEDEFKDESYLGIRLAEIEDMDYHKKSMEARLE